MATRKPRRKVAPKSPKKPSAPKKRAQAPTPKAPVKEGQGRLLPIEIDPSAVEQTLRQVRDQLVHWANKGRYTKVRFKFRGKQLLPDLPLAALIAAEGLTFYWTGILRALLFNLAGKTLLDVELVNEADGFVQKGREAILAGDLDTALAHLRTAVDIDRDHAAAHLQLGIAFKLQGEVAKARSSLQRARSLDPAGLVGQEAERILGTLGGSQPSALATTRASSP